MPVVIDEIVVDVPTTESTATSAGGSATAQATSAWSAELARRLDDELNLAFERRERLAAD